MPAVVYVYSGDGAGQRSILSAVESLKTALHGVQGKEDLCVKEVRQLNGLDLVEGGWQETCVLLVFPGGADVPYANFLNGQGNEVIRDFVEGGGSYLGLCAGGYYACRRIEFEIGSPLEVKGERELAFFPGLAKGAVEPGFDYQSEAGTYAVPLRFRNCKHNRDWNSVHDYSNGGPSFIVDPDEDTSSIDILAEYGKDGSPSAVKCKVGKGIAILCGTHPELSSWWMDANCNTEYMERSHPELERPKLADLVDKAIAIRGILADAQEKREEFWKSLLAAAGLMEKIRWHKTHLEIARINAKKANIRLDALLSQPLP